MKWRIYQVIFRLRSPLHIGWGKVGNLQRTRPYITGRVLWGALTMRLTRDRANGRGSTPNAQNYQRVGLEVHQSLAFTYFYPATKSENEYQVSWPWLNEDSFRYRFLSSYSGTALSYPHQSAATGMLHEVEFISPNTLDTGEPVFLAGYLFEKSGSNLAWQSACKRQQLGGERGYGWGSIELVAVSEPGDSRIFDGNVEFKGEGDLPVIQLTASKETPGYLLAHTLTANLPAAGEVEPLVGREWRSQNSRHRHAGQHVTFNDICFVPGSKINNTLDFIIETFGMWRRLPDAG